MNKQLILIITFILVYYTTSFSQPNENKIIDYSNSDNWSKLTINPTHDIDVFFVHPTTYGPPSNGNYNANINDSLLNAKTDKFVIDKITDIFKKNCNIYAPRYRQMNIEVLSMPQEAIDKYLKVPVSDIRNAFIYYLKNINNGRPYILAAHSQGSNILQVLLVDDANLFDKNKIVAAYLPGWTFTNSIIDKIGLPLGDTPEQAGCILTWNTIGPRGTSPVLKEDALCVNPLSWSSDSLNYPAIDNKGAIILDKDNIEIEINNFTSARINNIGALEIPTPKENIYNRLNMSMGPQCYHRYDYDFFYYNIMDNVQVRCNSYLNN